MRVIAKDRRAWSARRMTKLIAHCAAATLPLASLVSPALAQQPAPTTAPSATTDSAAAADTSQIRRLTVRGGESKVIDAPWPVKRLSVTDPAIADVDLTSPRTVQVQGKAPGATEVILWREHGDVWQAQ